MTTYTITLLEDENGDVILPLPQELLEGSNPWLIDDELVWEINDDDTFVLINKSWTERNKK